MDAFTTNASSTPGVWGIHDNRAGGAAGIVDLSGAGGNLETNNPLGIGAASLSLGASNNDKAEVGIFGNFGTFGDAVTAGISIGYDFYKQFVSGGNAASAPALKIGLTNGLQSGYLIYEPYVSPTVSNPAPDVWTTEAITSTSGRFWWSGGLPGGPSSSAGGPPFQELNVWASDSVLANATIGYIGMGMGTYNPSSVGYFDNLSLKIGSMDETFDFEPASTPAVPEPASLALGVFGLAGCALRSLRFKARKAA